MPRCVPGSNRQELGTHRAPTVRRTQPEATRFRAGISREGAQVLVVMDA